MDQNKEWKRVKAQEIYGTIYWFLFFYCILCRTDLHNIGFNVCYIRIHNVKH